MRRNVTLLQVMMGMCGFLAAAHSVSATSIPIANAGFESPALGDNAFTNNNIPDWSGTDAGETNNFGVFNPSTTFFPAEAPEGLNVAYIERGAIVQQLNATLEPGEYTLTVFVGDSVCRSRVAIVQLRAGGSVLAQASTPVPANGTFGLISVTYVATGSDPLLGQLLQIHLIDNASDKTTEPYFDEVRLDSTDFTSTAARFSLPQAPFGGGVVDGTDAFEFVPTTDLLVTALGWYDDRGDGLLVPHPVGIFDVLTQGLVTPPTTVTSAAPLDATTGFRFVSLDYFATGGHGGQSIQRLPSISSIPAM